jgi:hypothetical protein
MKEFDVKIQAIVTKTIRVEANDEDSATELAHQSFTTSYDGEDEGYQENTISCDEVK